MGVAVHRRQRQRRRSRRNKRQRACFMTEALHRRSRNTRGPPVHGHLRTAAPPDGHPTQNGPPRVWQRSRGGPSCALGTAVAATTGQLGLARALCADRNSVASSRCPGGGGCGLRAALAVRGACTSGAITHQAPGIQFHLIPIPNKARHARPRGPHLTHEPCRDPGALCVNLCAVHCL